MIFMWNYNYTDELYHYGVKGMKWGVRKDIRNNRRKIQKEEYDRLYKEYGIDEERKRLRKKYSDIIDPDDMELVEYLYGKKAVDSFERVYALENKAIRESQKRARDFVVEKYGETQVKAVERFDTAKSRAFTAALYAIPVTVIAGAMVSDNRKRGK